MSIFKAITQFQTSLSNRCHRGYEDTIARIIREQLEIIFYTLLSRDRQTEVDEGLKVTAVLLSWGMYGASVEWRRNRTKITAEDFITSAIPYILSGIDGGSAKK